MSAASVFARVRNNGELEVPEAIGEAADGRDCAGTDTWEASELLECDLEVIGTIRCWTSVASAGSCTPAGFGGFLYSNSGGISSGGGIGKPRAAAMS